MGQLSGGIAHDFNNLLTIIIGNLESASRLLARAKDHPDGRLERLLANAMIGAQRAATLTRRLLAFSRRQPLDPKPIDVNRLVHGLADFFRRSLPPGIELQIDCASYVWLTEADPTELQSAVLNLVINARDALSAGGELTIKTSNLKIEQEQTHRAVQIPPGQYLVITVTDTGTGMPEQVVDRAFDPFFN